MNEHVIPSDRVGRAILRLFNLYEDAPGRETLDEWIASLEHPGMDAGFPDVAAAVRSAVARGQ